ncbi:hypothetical protein SAMN05216344_11634 [Polaromonas sp. OV174]|uniref:hypothetical protein n=1 Tax=Polaromonas sp. OV174 TaxID=1855300 RepID=UPI0008F32E57|nr:hypothetical protein [Polaromonas sp. OV174]SFC39792.1 hypothetical protein SAMN05216344_11634 [Polaromonas sp. OV174]
MSYSLTLYAYEDATDQERRDAEKRFRKALDETLGDASLVLPVYQAYRRIVSIYGEAPAPDTLTDAEQQILDQWQAAETAAVTAAFGPNRYMGEAQFEIGA